MSGPKEGVRRHSVKVPTPYKTASKLLQKVFEEGGSAKSLMFGQQGPRMRDIIPTITKISEHKNELDRLIVESKILENNPRLGKYLCLVLMNELLFRSGRLSGESLPVQTVRDHEEIFRKLLESSNEAADDNKIEKTGTTQKVIKPRYVRVNTNLMSRAEAIELFETFGYHEVSTGDTELATYDTFLETVRNLGDSDFVSDIHVKNLFVFSPSSRRFWAKHDLVQECKLLLQDKASCLPPVLLDPPRGSIVLDMCAAPGMKTTQLAAQMKNKGTIYAVEHNNRRYKTLNKFIKQTKSTIVQTIEKDALTLDDNAMSDVEYILVDPSCSGSGMVNRLFSTEGDHSSERLILLAALQCRMLVHAMKMFYSAKKIVYSTCSIYPEENENVVQRALALCPDWQLVKPLEFAEKWKHFGSPKWKHIGKKCLYAKPSVDMTDGFFVAIFERSIDITQREVFHDPDRDFLEQIRQNFDPTPLQSIKDESSTSSGDEGNTVVKKERIDNVRKEEEQTVIKKESSEALQSIVVKSENVDNVEIANDSIVTQLKEKKIKKEQPVDETELKKKKKKSKRDVSPVETEETTNVPLKEKKKKHDVSPAETEETSDVPLKEKKKKRKHDNLSTESIANEGDIATSEYIQKKKKKHKVDDDLEEAPNDKKSKRKDDDADILAIDDLQNTEENTKVKKKKKRKNVDINLDDKEENEIKNNIEVATESAPKKKKKKKDKSI